MSASRVGSLVQATVLAEPRRSLYGILAEDGPGDETQA